IGDNSAPTGPDIFGVINSLGYNQIENISDATFTPATGDVTGLDPQLGGLQNNGGLTNTHLPSASSPVLNTIPNGTDGCGTTVLLDQRGSGHPRPSGGACDKGAVERQPADPPTPTPTPGGSPSPTPTATATATIPPPTPTPTPTPSPTHLVSGTVGQCTTS